MVTIRILRFGDQLGIAVPEELRKEFGLHEGDEVDIRRTERGIEPTSAASDVERALAIARECMDEYREALSILAKS